MYRRPKRREQLGDIEYSPMAGFCDYGDEHSLLDPSNSCQPLKNGKNPVFIRPPSPNISSQNSSASLLLCKTTGWLGMVH